MNRSSQTIGAYIKRGKQLWLRFAKTQQIPSQQLSPTEFLSWLETVLPDMRPATRRQYIASSKEWLSGSHPIPFFNEDDLTAAKEKVSRMQSHHYSHCAMTDIRSIPKTSSKKMRRFNLKEFLNFCRRTRIKSKWMEKTVLLMTVNTLVGLRPCEWRTAYLLIKNKRNYLVVRNAKHSNGRSHGNFRHIDITDFQHHAIKLVEHQVQTASLFANDDRLWNLYINAVRNTAYRILRKEKPGLKKYPSIYSSRHQFAADAKASGLAAVEIAAMMGHAVDETVKMHYGRKVHGDRRCRAKAASEDISKVIQKENRYHRRKNCQKNS